MDNEFQAEERPPSNGTPAAQSVIPTTIAVGAMLLLLIISGYYLFSTQRPVATPDLVSEETVDVVEPRYSNFAAWEPPHEQWLSYVYTLVPNAPERLAFPGRTIYLEEHLAEDMTSIMAARSGRTIEVTTYGQLEAAVDNVYFAGRPVYVLRDPALLPATAELLNTALPELEALVMHHKYELDIPRPHQIMDTALEPVGAVPMNPAAPSLRAAQLGFLVAVLYELDPASAEQYESDAEVAAVRIETLGHNFKTIIIDSFNFGQAYYEAALQTPAFTELLQAAKTEWSVGMEAAATATASEEAE